MQIVRTIVAAVLLFSPVGAIADVDLSGAVGDDRVSLVYDPTDGSLGLDAAGYRVSTFEVTSASANFIHPPFFMGPPPHFVPDPSRLILLRPAQAIWSLNRCCTQDYRLNSWHVTCRLLDRCCQREVCLAAVTWFICRNQDRQLCSASAHCA